MVGLSITLGAARCLNTIFGVLGQYRAQNEITLKDRPMFPHQPVDHMMLTGVRGIERPLKCGFISLPNSSDQKVLPIHRSYL